MRDFTGWTDGDVKRDLDRAGLAQDALELVARAAAEEADLHYCEHVLDLLREWNSRLPNGAVPSLYAPPRIPGGYDALNMARPLPCSHAMARFGRCPSCGAENLHATYDLSAADCGPTWTQSPFDDAVWPPPSPAECATPHITISLPSSEEQARSARALAAAVAAAVAPCAVHGRSGCLACPTGLRP